MCKGCAASGRRLLHGAAAHHKYFMRATWRAASITLALQPLHRALIFEWGAFRGLRFAAPTVNYNIDTLRLCRRSNFIRILSLARYFLFLSEMSRRSVVRREHGREKGFVDAPRSISHPMRLNPSLSQASPKLCPLHYSVTMLASDDASHGVHH